MSIDPKPGDVGRKVRLECFGGPTLIGELVAVEVMAMVKFGDLGRPVATDPSRLNWAENASGCPNLDDKGSGGSELPLDA